MNVRVVIAVVVRCSCGGWIAAHHPASHWSSLPCLRATVSSTRASTPPSSSPSSSRVTTNRRVRPSPICPSYLLRPTWCLVQPPVPQIPPYIRSITIYDNSLVNYYSCYSNSYQVEEVTGGRSRLLESLPARGFATSGPRKVAVSHCHCYCIRVS